MKAFTVIETTDPRCTGYVKALSWCGGIEYIPRDIWERESLATADTRDPDFYDRHEGEVAVLVGEGLGGFVADAHGPAGAHVRGGASETEESALRALCEALESGSLA